MTCQSPLREVAGRWSMSTRSVALLWASSVVMVAETRRTARRARMGVGSINISDMVALQCAVEWEKRPGDIILRPLNNRLFSATPKQWQRRKQPRVLRLRCSQAREQLRSDDSSLRAITFMRSSAQAVGEEMVGDADGVGDDGQRWVNCAA